MATEMPVPAAVTGASARRPLPTCSRSLSWSDLAEIADLSDDDMYADADLVDAVAACFTWFYHLVKALTGAQERGEELPAPVLQAASRGVDEFPGIVCGAWCIGAGLCGDYSEHYRECWKQMWHPC
jgi:hypothetical protein